MSLFAFIPLLACGEDPRPPLGPGAEFSVTAVSAPAAAAAVPWSLFGDAALTNQGAAPNPWAVALRSLGTGFAGLAFRPRTPLTFAQLTTLSADFNVTDDECGGGSPRFQLNIDENADGNFDENDGNIFVHFGPSPSFTGCGTGWQSTGNLIGNNAHGRYDASQVGGSGFGNYQSALAAAGTAPVLGVQLVVDGSWFFDDDEQTVFVDNVQVNAHRLTARSFLP